MVEREMIERAMKSYFFSFISLYIFFFASLSLFLCENMKKKELYP